MNRYKHALLAVAGLGGIIIASVLALRLPREFVDRYIDEDGYAETAGALFLVVGAILLFLLFRRSRSGAPEQRAGRIKQLTYLALALLFFTAAGEEISWGQRILGVETPEPIKEINRQEEINLHNLYGDEGGQNISWRLFMAFWIGWGIILPVAAATSARLRRTLSRYVPVLPVWFAILFAGQQALWHPVEANWRSDPSAWNGTYRPGFDDDRPYRVETLEEARASGIDGPAGLIEVMETNVQLLLMAGAVALFFGTRRRPAEPGAGRTAPSPERSAGPAAVA